MIFNSDHPRGCGESISAARRTARRQGSPPRMRGKPRAKAYMSAPLRITPADAGKTFPAERLPAPPWDHPRGCGENTVSRDFYDDLIGSPPQVRGKHEMSTAVAAGKRITPAGAGKTMGYYVIRCPQGSPPQVRGKPQRVLSMISPERITPAGAGKTQVLADGGNTDEDHPRRCGENR